MISFDIFIDKQKQTENTVNIKDDVAVPAN